MTRMKLGLGIATSAVIVALVVLMYDFDALRTSNSALDTSRGEVSDAPNVSPNIEDPNASTEDLQTPNSSNGQLAVRSNGDQQSAIVHISDKLDEDAAQELLRRMATHSIRMRYRLLIDDLDLTSEERDALFELLVDDWIRSSTIRSSSAPDQQGDPVDTDEQLQRIAAIIGEPKQQEFSRLVEKIDVYQEVQRIESLFSTNEIPLTETQQRELLAIVATIQEEYLLQQPEPTNMDRSPIEEMEYALAHMAEYERHLMELVSSVLSAEQVVYLDRQYQFFALSRLDALEQQKQELFDGTRDEEDPLTFRAWSGD